VYFKVLRMVTIRNAVFWVETLCGIVRKENGKMQLSSGALYAFFSRRKSWNCKLGKDRTFHPLTGWIAECHLEISIKCVLDKIYHPPCSCCWGGT
jgi:hypothetical protein